MSQAASRMDAEQFTAVAATCRWSARSLAIARDILVDGASLSDTATKHQVSQDHARVLLARFQDKAERQRLDSFMQREQPKLVLSALTPFSNELRILRDKGYDINQLVSYLKDNGVKTSATTVRKFLRSNRA